MNRWIDKDVVHMYKAKLLSYKKDNFSICSNMYGLGGYYIKWKKSEIDRKVLFDITYRDDYFNVPSNTYLIISFPFYYEFCRKQEFEYLLYYSFLAIVLSCETLLWFVNMLNTKDILDRKAQHQLCYWKLLKKQRRQQLSLVKNSWPNNFENICQMSLIKLQHFNWRLVYLNLNHFRWYK